jgi:alkanesulfonate monooxygenase SsuD/methylene tetrahydromethanopterin reductase-like flavin-dependent oxidoreductase (luciferase family)
MSRPTLRLGVVYDFRNTPPMRMSNPDLYAAIIDQVVWLDRLGLDLVWFTEHHFVEDGYLASWVPVAAAMAARTHRVRFSCDVCLLPFNHPVRLAEDLAVLDTISNGRVELGVGMGYAAHEFAGFGIPQSRRVSLTEEGIEILRRAFTGERFSFHGKRYQLEGVKIRPGYVQPGGPPLWVAAMSEAGALRAARHDAHLLPQGPREWVLDPWARALRESNRDPAKYRIGIIRSCLVTDDPERDWPAVREGERYRQSVYQSFRAPGTGGGGVAGNTDAARIPQAWVVGNAEECVEKLAAFIAEFGITDLVSWAVPPGLRPDHMNPFLERYAKEVAPRLRARFNGAAG